MQEIEINIDDLANFLFVKNNSTRVALSLPQLECQKDLFYFFLDLFCKGLMIFFGNNNRVEIEKLTYNDFDNVKKKMKCCGIIAHLEVLSAVDTNINLLDGNPINVSAIEELPDNLNLEEYQFRLLTLNGIYIVYFSLEIPTNVYK